MWWKLAGLGLLAIGFAALLVMPISTVDIQVDLPPPNVMAPADADRAFLIFMLVVGVASFSLVVGIFALIGWLMWRVVRHHRRLKQQVV